MPLKRKWTRPIDKDGKVHSYNKGKQIVYFSLKLFDFIPVPVDKTKECNNRARTSWPIDCLLDQTYWL